MRLNEHLEYDSGPVVFAHACKMGLEGIVSKRLGSTYRSGRRPDFAAQGAGKRPTDAPTNCRSANPGRSEINDICPKKNFQ